VVLRLTVTVEGLPRQVAVETSTGFPLLDNSALEYAKANWRFEPARQDGKPVEGTYTRAVVFRLD
jgi:protein TonB